MQTRSFGRVATAFALTIAAAALNAATEAPRAYKPGDEVSDGTYVYRIIRCNGSGEWDECEYQAYRDGQASGAPGRMTNRNLRAGEQRSAPRQPAATAQPAAPNTGTSASTGAAPVVTKPAASQAARPQPAPAGAAAGADGKWKVGDRLEVNDRAFWYPAQIVAIQGDKYRVRFEGYKESDDKWIDASRMRPIGGHRVTAECAYNLPGDVSASAAPSEQLFKKKIWQRYFALSQAGGSPSVNAPLDTGIAFVAFQTEPSLRNVVTNVPGRGATRANNGAPPDATIYPVKTRYVLCKKFRDGVSRSMYDETMHCFKNKEGQWMCDGAGVPKITQMN